MAQEKQKYWTKLISDTTRVNIFFFKATPQFFVPHNDSFINHF